MNCSHVLPSLVFLISIIFEERFLWSKFFVLNLYYLTILYGRPCIISRKIEIDWQKCLMLMPPNFCVFPFLDMSKQRDEEGKKKENIQFSVYISTLKTHFWQIHSTNGYTHLSLFTFVLDKIKTEFETNHHADCNICQVNIPTIHIFRVYKKKLQI